MEKPALSGHSNKNPREQSAMFSTTIKLQFVVMDFVLSILDRRFRQNLLYIVTLARNVWKTKSAHVQSNTGFIVLTFQTVVSLQ